MKIAWFPNQIAQNGVQIVNYLVSNMSKHFHMCANSMDSDVAIIWSMLWHGRMKGNQTVYNHYRRLGKPVLIIEVGSLVRNHTWRVCVNNLQSYVSNQKSIELLSYKQNNFKSDRSFIVICMQNELSGNIHLSDYTKWIKLKFEEACDWHGAKKVFVRHHPRYRSSIVNHQEISTHLCFDHVLSQAKAIVNYNSGPSIQAALSNTPIICSGSSLCYPVSTTIQQLHSPVNHENYSEWLSNISHSEFYTEQFVNGEVSEQLFKLLTNQL